MYTNDDFNIFKQLLNNNIKKQLKFQTIKYSIKEIRYEDDRFIFDIQSYLTSLVDNNKTIISNLTIIYNNNVLLINTHNNNFTFYELNTIQDVIKTEMSKLK